MVSTEYVSWRDVKARAGDVDPRSEEDRRAGEADAVERRDAYVRGHQLAEMRKAAGITQTQLARNLGVSQSRVSKIERGDISGVDVIRAYVVALGGTVELVATVGDRTWKVA